MTATDTFQGRKGLRYRGLIYDIGMHNGDDTARYLEQGYSVLAVEADPDLVRDAQQRFRTPLETGQLSILNIGVSDRPGTATFWICDDNTIWNSFIKELAARNGCRHHSIEVPIRTLPDIMAQYGTPEYLKIDVEGYDELCIRSLAARPLPKYISAEDNTHVTNRGVPAMLDALHEVGYRKFKLISQHDHHALGPRNRSLVESIVSPLRFRKNTSNPRQDIAPDGSSGPWGEESDGKWLTVERAAKVYFEAKEAYSTDPRKRDFWVDWHAVS